MAYTGIVGCVNNPHINPWADGIQFDYEELTFQNGVLEDRDQFFNYRDIKFADMAEHILPWIDEAIDGIEEP